ncbi:MAG: riboflavin synthase [bacterium]
MFTGLIERIGVVNKCVRSVAGLRLEIASGEDGFDLAAGDSVAVDGLCLTASSVSEESFVVDVSRESLARSTLQEVRNGRRVNLERSLRLGDRLGGHMVTGHIDGTGRIAEARPEGGFARLTIAAPPEVLALMVEKGSIAVDGISLTVNGLMADRFWMTVIPETLARTTLGNKTPGDLVNLETDLLGKYVARLLGFRTQTPAPQEGLLEKLKQEGFF